MMLRTIAVFCGSALNTPEIYSHAAFEAGRTIARQGRRLVYGSGSGGLMGQVAMGAQKEGGYVIGVNVEYFRDYPYTLATNEYLVIDTMQNRKLTMIDKSDGCVALPGGMGTLDELTEIACMNQIGLRSKPFGLLNIDGYFDGLLTQFKRAVQDGFMAASDLERILVAEDMETLLAKMDAAQEP